MIAIGMAAALTGAGGCGRNAALMAADGSTVWTGGGDLPSSCPAGEVAKYCHDCLGTLPFTGCGRPAEVPSCPSLNCEAPVSPQACPGGPRRGDEVPTVHRAVAEACAPSNASPPVPDGGTPSCKTDFDCGPYPQSPFIVCLRGRCSFDQCLTDADCGGTSVCSCANDYTGGGGNQCLPSTCRVDADCGAGGFCSPSPGRCGWIDGYHCHGKADSCVDETKNCTSCGSACIYAPESGAFVCGVPNCLRSG
jgi:hypothetical protein